MSRRICDLWAEGPGGWAHEWSHLAEQAEKDGDLLKAPFERHVIDVDFRGETAQVPLHLYVPESLPADAPTVLVFSGVDTWKAEVHAPALATARPVGARVATVDMAGAGESPVANGPDGELYVGDVLDWLRRRFPEARKVGAVGFSFGGHWTIKPALRRMVDAAVSIGGLIDTAFTPEAATRLRYGMPGIFGDSLRLDAEPSLAELQAATAAFSLRTQGLLDDWGSDPVPLLYVNGDQDQHVRPTTPGRSSPARTPSSGSSRTPPLRHAEGPGDRPLEPAVAPRPTGLTAPTAGDRGIPETVIGARRAPSPMCTAASSAPPVTGAPPCPTTAGRSTV